MVQQKEIDERKMVQMYLDGEIVNTIMRHFDIDSRGLYRRLKANGIKANRKFDIPWTEEEDERLIVAKKASLTGSDVYCLFPNRMAGSVKSRVQKLRIDKRIG